MRLNILKSGQNSVKNNEQYKSAFKELECCVIIPTYNNASTIGKVAEAASAYCNDVYIVNDGCTDETLSILKEIEQVTVIGYQKNRGKGYALKYGFKHAVKQGYKYAITLDSDGQHYAEDLPLFLDKLREEPKAIIIGAREMSHENVPGKSNFGKNFSNFWVKVETGISLPDTQSGYRLYPIAELSKIRFFANKFDFEVEVLVRSAWKGIELLSIPINVFYPKKEERVSHFRPFKDFTRISILNTILVTLAFIYFRPRDIVRKYRKKSIKQIIREDILQGGMPVSKIAIAIGFGVFMGILPIWGYQLAVGFIIAHFLKINKPIFFVAANISLPPMIPLILYLSYVCGSFVLGDGSWVVDMDLTLGAIKANLKQYILGAIAFSIIAGILSGFLSYFSIILIKKFRAK